MTQENGPHGPQHITREEFESDVVGGEGAVIVDIWAEWCGPCRMLSPFLHKLAAEFEGTVRVVKLDYDANEDLMQKYGFQGIPALLLFNAGEVVDMIVGFSGYTTLRKPIDAFIEKVTGQPTPAPSTSEREFAAAEATAEKGHDEIALAARAEFFRVYRPAARNAKRTEARANKALAEGKIDETEKTRRVERANARLEAVSNPAQETYRSTMKPVTAAYIHAAEVAAGIFVETHSTAGEVRFCAIGDPSCRV